MRDMSLGGGAGEYSEERHLLRSNDGDGVCDDRDVEAQSPPIRGGGVGVRDLFKHLDRGISLSGRRLSFTRLENSRVDREHHHPSSSSSPPSPLSSSVGHTHDDDHHDFRHFGHGHDEGNDVLGDSAPPEWALLLIGCLIGVAAGICVAAFNSGVHVIHEWAWAGTPNEGAAWLRLQRLADTWHRILLIPVTGGVIVGMMHGLLEILDQIRQSTSSQRQGLDLLAGIFPTIKAIQAAVTLGTGCSLGPEGPSVDIGKSCANGFALMMENNRERRIALTAAGAASGIASGFNAAVAGCFFAIETVLRPLRAENSPPFTTAMIILASVISSTVSNALMGTQSAFTVPSYDLKSAAELPLYLILGMLCGAVSVVFSRLVTWFTKSFDFIKDKFGLPAIVCPALGGLGAGMIALKYPGILYWGFTNVEEILHTGKSASAPGIWLLSQLAAAKVVATALCKGSGLVGGLYAPSLMIGAAIGAVFGGSAAEIINRAIPGNTAVAQPQAYALVGMAATLASVCSVPLTSVLLLFELTKDYRILLPLMGAVGLAIWVPSVANQGKEGDASDVRNTGRRYSSVSSAEHKNGGGWRQADGADSLELSVIENTDHKTLDEEAILECVKVSRVMSKNYVNVSLGTTLREARKFLKESRQNCVLVVDDDDLLAGILTSSDIRRYSSKNDPIALDEYSSPVSLVCTRKITYRGQERGILTCYPDTTVGVAMELMEARGVKQLPVVKRSGGGGDPRNGKKRRRLVGILYYDSISVFLRDEMKRRRSTKEMREDVGLNGH
ncbi:PREDICTED: chloride channel protein CLC-f isoform X2 [Tarenaya hassleriana]|uniref:chloride channel protein CLC-f isoform X1 n=1 Tax=Tarenaya hassleriana TaxID=28532 RepID=UPI00053C2B54|nr:PREDICTED: chloride channel protein CLC-f isoform X1 [Tarenaya hassleriana]XP_010534844.1 PREDICTED: chloride channel protein CLC-f isoform X2 [Tarenaya hassleriana]